MVIGSAVDSATLKRGLLFVKIDTFGKVLDHRLHIDSQNDFYQSGVGWAFTQTSDGGYLATMVTAIRDSFFLAKLDINGDLVFFKEYPMGIMLFFSPKTTIETENGYLMAGYQQLNNYDFNGNLLKFDLEGNLLWHEQFGSPDTDDFVNAMIVKNDNAFVLAGGKANKGTSSSSNPDVDWVKPWIFGVDSLGEVQWEWTGEHNIESSIHNFQTTEDGGWIYGTTEKMFWNTWDWALRPKVVRRDSAFNLLWEKDLAESAMDQNIIRTISHTPDGNWLAAGSIVLPEPIYFYVEEGVDAYQGGCHYKLTPEGDSLWRRCDTLGLEDDISYRYFSQTIILPSGSSISVGHLNGFVDSGIKWWGWVIKLSPKGCLEQPCDIPTETVYVERKPDFFHIWPNPVADYFNIESKGQKEFMLYDMNGRLLLEFSLLHGSKRIDCPELPPGMYFLQATDDAGNHLVRKMIKLE